MVEVAGYWNQRAERYGKRAVFHLKHPESALDDVTRVQRQSIFESLTPLLRGDEKLALDFGCGIGRFSVGLAEAIHGKVLGIDPTLPLIKEAKTIHHPDVRFVHCPDGRAPVGRQSVDVVLVCLVLGGLRGSLLDRAVSEVCRVLKPGGLLVLVENTSELPDAEHWSFRSVKDYQRLFPGIDLLPRDGFLDMGEQVSVMIGRDKGGTDS